MPQAKGIREVGWVDCAGGGQITVEKGIAYVGHMAAPHGTSLFDVRDPEERQAALDHRDAEGHALPQGALQGRHHGREPRAGRPAAAGLARRF